MTRSSADGEFHAVEQSLNVARAAAPKKDQKRAHAATMERR